MQLEIVIYSKFYLIIFEYREFFYRITHNRDWEFKHTSEIRGLFGGGRVVVNGPGPSRPRYFPRDMLLMTTTARERAWRLLKILSQFFDYVFLELSRAFAFVWKLE